MRFEIDYYRKILVYSPSLPIMLCVLLIVISLLAIYKPDYVKWLPLRISSNKTRVIFIVIYTMTIAFFSSNIKFSLLFANEEDAIVYYGKITEISNAPVQFRYRHNGELVSQKYITIGEDEFYVLTSGGFEAGDDVRISYLAKSRVILEIRGADDPRY